MPSRRNRTIADTSWGRASDFSEVQDHASEIEEIEINPQNELHGLPYFKACLFATILEDILYQLRVLDECSTHLRINKTLAEMPKLLAHKYGVKEKSNKDELEDIDSKNLRCIEYKLQKLQSDRLRRELNRQLRQQRNHIKSVTYDKNSEIEYLKSGLEDSDLNAETRSRYVTSWQRARSEQHLQTILDVEDRPLVAIEEYKRKAEQEQRVHTEVELLINIKINEVLVKVDEWMNKYDKDIEQLDLKVQLKKNSYEHMYDRRLELEATLEKHAQLIHDWVTFKEAREAERQHRELFNSAAVTVQAWWRGMLVRQELGPYKPAKRRPPPLPEKKTGKKKK